MANTVKDALKLKTVNIVAYDWLEDSLQAQSHKRESKYRYTIQKEKAKNKACKKKVIRQKHKKEGEYFHVQKGESEISYVRLELIFSRFCDSKKF